MLIDALLYYLCVVSIIIKLSYEKNLNNPCEMRLDYGVFGLIIFFCGGAEYPATL